MLQDLDKTLEKLLKLELPALFAPSSGTEVRISFTTPDEESMAQKPVINLFLYEVRENMELRNPAYSMARQSNGSAVKKLPPVRVDCSYLITVWPADSSDAETEHRLLGEVMKVLLRYPKIPAEVLQGSLQGQQPPLRANSLRTSQLQSFGEFWQAMGGKPKATLNYTVTISVGVWEAAEVVPLVMDK